MRATRCLRSAAAKSPLGMADRLRTPKWLCMSAIGTVSSAHAAKGASTLEGRAAWSSVRRRKPSVGPFASIVRASLPDGHTALRTGGRP